MSPLLVEEDASSLLIIKFKVRYVCNRDVLTPGASEASPTHTGPTFRVTESLVITVTEKLTVRTILSLLAHVCAIGPLQSDRAEALPCHMITVGGATLTLLSTLRSIEPT